MKFDTKIALVIRSDLEAWQKLNVAAFLSSGIAAAFPECIGEPYEDKSGTRYHALIEGVQRVFITGVHMVYDQAVALRLVSLIDRLYDAGVPVVASGEKMNTVFSEEMLAGGFRKKYLRATSRLLALTHEGTQLHA